jgi:hypothetical protein
MDHLAVAGAGFHAEMRVLFQDDRVVPRARKLPRDGKAYRAGPNYNGIAAERFHGNSVSRFLCRFPQEPLQLLPASLVSNPVPIQESKMKFVALAALAAFAATPVLADSVVREQARADYHQAKADAARSQMQKEDAQDTAADAQVNAGSAQAQANAAQDDAASQQALANASKAKADVAQNQADASQAQAEGAQSEAAQAAANRDAALDRADDARAVARSN